MISFQINTPEVYYLLYVTDFIFTKKVKTGVSYTLQTLRFPPIDRWTLLFDTDHYPVDGDSWSGHVLPSTYRWLGKFYGSRFIGFNTKTEVYICLDKR